MKRSIIILACSFVSAATLLAQTSSPQTPAAPGTAQKTSATTAKTGVAKPAVSKTPVSAQWITTTSGLKYRDVVVGKGPQPKVGDDILVNYTGRFTNGKMFDSSRLPGRTPFELHVGRGEVIKGWDEGLLTMHVGGTRKLIIPPALAYGAKGYPGAVPPNSVLTFDVELLKIK